MNARAFIDLNFLNLLQLIHQPALKKKVQAATPFSYHKTQKLVEGQQNFSIWQLTLLWCINFHVGLRGYGTTTNFS